MNFEYCRVTVTSPLTIFGLFYKVQKWEDATLSEIWRTEDGGRRRSDLLFGILSDSEDERGQNEGNGRMYDL